MPGGQDPFGFGTYSNPAGPSNPSNPFDQLGAPWQQQQPWAPSPTPPATPEPESNSLATLSIVFALIFAPVGAVLGHLALGEIAKGQQVGRDRAYVGLTLSYVMILVAVVGLVVWFALPSGESTPATANQPAAVSSSSAPTATTAIPAPSAPVPAAKPTAVPQSISGANFTNVLLNGGDLSALLNQQFDTAAKERQVGALDAMPNGLANEAAASPHECVGATRVAQRSVYQSSSVQHFASEKWWTKVSGPVMNVEEAVIVLASPADAQALFTAFTNQWQACEGRTMTVLAGKASDGSYYVTTANGVRVADSVLSAVLLGDHSTGGWARSDPHALGVKGNCIVEVEVATYGVAPGKDPLQGMGNAAIDLTRAMMERIA